MGWTVFELAVNCFQAGLIVYLTTNCFKYESGQWTAVKKALLFLSCAVFFSLFLFFPMPPVDLMVFLLPMLFSFACSDNSVSQVLYWNCLFALLFSLVAGMANHAYALLSALAASPFPDHGWQYLVYIIASNLALYVLSRFIVRQNVLEDYLSPSIHAIFFIAVFSILVAEESVYSYHQRYGATATGGGWGFLIASYLALTVCALLTVLLFHTMSENAVRESRYQAELSILSQAQQHQDELTRTHQELVAYRHDMKQHLQVLSEMVSRENIRDAEAYLAEIQRSEAKKLFFTGNSAVDALLSAKVSVMESHGIAFHFVPHPLGALPVSSVDFCSIVGNLLDNATEGILRIPAEQETERRIRLTFHCSGDVFFILCENPCAPDTLSVRKGRFRSSKGKDDQVGMHGIGIHSIESIAEKAEGRARFRVEEDVFCAEVVLPFLRCDDEARIGM